MTLNFKNSKKVIFLSSLLILSIWVGLSSYALWSMPLSFDELIQYDLFSRLSLPEILKYITVEDRQMPLNYLILYPLTEIKGISIQWLRLPSFTFFLFSLIFLYRGLRYQVGKLYSLWGACLLASTYLSFSFSYSMRPYALMLMLSTLCFSLYNKMNLRGLIFRDVLVYIVALFLLAASHYFAAIVSIILFFDLYRKVNSKYRVWESLPWFHFFFGGILLLCMGSVLMGLLVGALHTHPNHQFPHLKKILYTFFLISGGSFFSSFILFYALYKKRMIKNDFVTVAITFGLPLIALVISYLYYPAFEFRFFVVCLPWSIVLLIKTLFERKTLLRGLVFLLIIGEVNYFTFFHHKSLSVKERLNVELVKRENPEMDSKEILFCGNCPSYYFSHFYHLCAGGWDLSLVPKRYSIDELDYVVIFKDNEILCREYIPTHWEKKSYYGLDVFKKP